MGSAFTVAKHTALIRRKPPVSAEIVENALTLPLAETQREICRQAHELASSGYRGEISEALAKRFGVREAVIDLVVALNSNAYERGFNCMTARLRDALAFAAARLRAGNLWAAYMALRRMVIDARIISGRLVRLTLAGE